MVSTLHHRADYVAIAVSSAMYEEAVIVRVVAGHRILRVTGPGHRTPRRRQRATPANKDADHTSDRLLFTSSHPAESANSAVRHKEHLGRGVRDGESGRRSFVASREDLRVRSVESPRNDVQSAGPAFERKKRQPAPVDAQRCIDDPVVRGDHPFVRTEGRNPPKSDVRTGWVVTFDLPEPNLIAGRCERRSRAGDAVHVAQ